jgi:hypothetical protein
VQGGVGLEVFRGGNLHTVFVVVGGCELDGGKNASCPQKDSQKGDNFLYFHLEKCEYLCKITNYYALSVTNYELFCNFVAQNRIF